VVENGEDTLEKKATSHYDLFDGFRLSLMFWRYEKIHKTVNAGFLVAKQSLKTSDYGVLTLLSAFSFFRLSLECR
jgi:hypothetical protein